MTCRSRLRRPSLSGLPGVIEEADDRGGLLQLGLELGNQGDRLGVQVIQVEDQQCGLLALGQLEEARHGLLSPLTNSTLMPSLRDVS